MFKMFMTLAPGIMLSLFLANNRVMHSWRQLGKRLYAIHGGDGAYQHPHAKAYYASTQQHSQDKLKAPHNTETACEATVNVSVNDAHREEYNDKPLGADGGVDGPCCCESQELGISSSQKVHKPIDFRNHNFERDVNKSLEQDCSLMNLSSCHHQSIRMSTESDDPPPNTIARFYSPCAYQPHHCEVAHYPSLETHGSSTDRVYPAQHLYGISGLQKINYSSPSKKKVLKHKKNHKRAAETIF